MSKKIKKTEEKSKTILLNLGNFSVSLDILNSFATVYGLNGIVFVDFSDLETIAKLLTEAVKILEEENEKQ